MTMVNMFFVAIVFSLAMLRLANGENLKIVAPSSYADVEGDGNLNAQCCPTPFRFQQLFLADDFSGLPQGGGFITSFAWRPDGDLVNSAREITLTDTLFRFSTTEMEELSTTFSENIGDDETVVRTGTFAVSTENTMLGNGTKAFDYVTEFETLFFYDPFVGNLLWDWTGSIEAQSLTDGYRTPSDVVFSSPPGPVGSRFGGYIVEFSLAPRGDLNGDSRLNDEDINLLANAIGTDDAFFDINNDRNVNVGDIEAWVHDIHGTWIGDSNLDGEFNSGDLVQVFQAGHYEDGVATAIPG